MRIKIPGLVLEGRQDPPEGPANLKLSESSPAEVYRHGNGG
jgi:hypothetical protein